MLSPFELLANRRMSFQSSGQSNLAGHRHPLRISVRVDQLGSRELLNLTTLAPKSESFIEFEAHILHNGEIHGTAL